MDIFILLEDNFVVDDHDDRPLNVQSMGQKLKCFIKYGFGNGLFRFRM